MKSKEQHSSEKAQRVSHPLYGSTLRNLLRVLWKYGPVPTRKWPQVLAALGSATARSPITLLESLSSPQTFRKMPPMPHPVFIVGHWRSGTTHLGNVLSKSPQFGYVSPIASGLPGELLTLGRYFRKSLEKTLPSDRLIDRVPVTPESPQEDEFGIANMFPISFLHGLYFPKHFKEAFTRGVFIDKNSDAEIQAWEKAFVKYLRKVYVDQGHKQLIIRNPAYTTRLERIKKVFPGAKFIHIHRNPYRVFPSMQNYFKKLLPALAWQSYEHLDLDSFILANYTHMMEELFRQSAVLAPADFIEISFEKLEENPLEVLEKVYKQLQLANFENALPSFEAYLKSIQNYKKNAYQVKELNQRVKTEWAPYIERWGYA